MNSALWFLEWIQALGAMIPRHRFLEWIQALGAISSVVVAVVSIIIVVVLSMSQSRSDRVSMTLTLHNTYRNLDAIQKLVELGHMVFLDVLEQNLRKENQEEEPNKTRNAVRRAFQKLTAGKEEEVEKWIAIFLHAAEVIYNCGWSETLSSRFCIKEILLDVYIEEVVWAFYGIRNGIYCNDLIKNRFYRKGDSKLPVYMLETMVMEYLRRDFKKRKDNRVVFRSHKEKGEGRGVVVRPKIKEFCNSIPLAYR